MLLLSTLFFVFAIAQDLDCPPFTAVNGCVTIKKSDKCETHFEFAIDPYTGKATLGPTACVPNPNSKYCIPSSTVPLCRPRCVTNQKDAFFPTTACSQLTTQASCARSVGNCGYNNVKCDWCAFDLTSNSCSTAFVCNDKPF